MTGLQSLGALHEGEGGVLLGLLAVGVQEEGVLVAVVVLQEKASEGNFNHLKKRTFLRELKFVLV